MHHRRMQAYPNVEIDNDPYGISLFADDHGAAQHVTSDAWLPTAVPSRGEDITDRRRLEYVTEDPGPDAGAECDLWSEFVPARDIPAITETRQRQVEQCGPVQTCKKNCKLALGGDLDVIGDARLASATDPNVVVELPFYAKLSGQVKIPTMPSVPSVSLPKLPSVMDVIADLRDPNSNRCQFMNQNCRDIAEFVSTFATDVEANGLQATVEAKADEIKEILVAKAKKRAQEEAAKAKKKALDAATGRRSDGAAATQSTQSINRLSFGLMTMGKIDQVDNLAETLCGLAGEGEDCVSSLPAVALSDVEATLQVANKEINVAGYRLQRGINRGATQDCENCDKEEAPPLMAGTLLFGHA
jgi:hypothetical protein